MKLTDREKKMLLALVVVSVFTLSFKFLIVPSIETINYSKSQMVELEMLKKEMNITVDEHWDIDDKIETEYINVKINNYFYENIDDTFVDNLMQDFTEAHNLNLTSLSFDLSNETSIESLSDVTNLLSDIINQKLKVENTEAVLTSKILDSLDNQETVEIVTDTTTNAVSSPVFYCTVNIHGNVDDVMNMVNHINESDKSIIVTGVNGSISGGVFDGSVSVEIYYII